MRSANISNATMAKLNTSDYVSLEVIDKLCAALHCQPGDLIEYTPKKEGEQLMATTKTNLYQLIEQLPESAVRLAEKMLQSIIAEFPDDSPRARLLAMMEVAPVDDEPISQEELQELEEARARIATGEGTSLEDLKKELGL